MIIKFKIFENKTDFKKYFISKFFDTFSICEILNIDIKTYKDKIKLLYVYNNDTKDMIDNTKSSPYFKSLGVLDNNILYSSNKLEDCMEVIKTLNDISIYNI